MNKRIVNDIHHLPRANPDTGVPPSSNPFAMEAFEHLFTEMYEADELAERGEDGRKALAIPDAGPYRASYSTSRCDRQLYYHLRNEPRSNPTTIADHWTFFIGKMVHEKLQPVLTKLFPGGSEQNIDLNAIGVPGSAHADQVAEVDGHATLVEITTVNGYKFKTMASRFNGPPKGPSYGKLMQAALAAKAAGIERIVVLVISLEKLSPSLASYVKSHAGQFLAEWHYTTTELEPQIDAEIRRINHILSLVDKEYLPARELHDPEYPVGATVDNPTAKPHASWTVQVDGNVVDAGTYWGCNYCPFQTTCKNSGD